MNAPLQMTCRLVGNDPDLGRWELGGSLGCCSFGWVRRGDVGTVIVRRPPCDRCGNELNVLVLERGYRVMRMLES